MVIEIPRYWKWSVYRITRRKPVMQMVQSNRIHVVSTVKFSKVDPGISEKEYKELLLALASVESLEIYSASIDLETVLRTFNECQELKLKVLDLRRTTTISSVSSEVSVTWMNFSDTIKM